MGSKEEQLAQYLKENLDNGVWKNAETKKDVERHQFRVREMKQAIEEEKQLAIITEYQDERDRGEYVAQVRIEEFKRYWPLFSRRSSLLDDEKFKLVAPFHTAERKDGQLFSFIAPQDIKTIYRYCNCGEFPKPLEEMIEAELALANEHLLYCTNIREETVIELSHPPQHKIGNWNCRACLRDIPLDSSNKIGQSQMTEAKSTIDWCPRFLRPFRQLSIEEYIKQIASPDPNRQNQSCYAGLLHVQLSILSEDDGEGSEHQKTYVIKTEVCDTCGFKAETKTEIQGRGE